MAAVAVSGGRVLAVGGLAAEARIARAAGWSAVIAGGRSALLRTRLEATKGRWDAVVSFGIAAGLDPALAAGAVVVADAMLDADGRTVPCDPTLAQAIRAGLGAAALRGTVAGIDAPLLGPADKAALHARTGARAADMESHIAAAFAAAAGVPFMAVRVVCDPAGRALPALAATALRPDGTSDLGGVLLGLLREPAALPALLRLARDSRTALATLARIAPTIAAALPP
ncbi:MAG TPA: phosphorylase [Hyphomicrobiales bacterium]|nr:phosphorylase [Hyphomicrobiales bacterium]